MYVCTCLLCIYLCTYVCLRTFILCVPHTVPVYNYVRMWQLELLKLCHLNDNNPYSTAFPYGNGMVLHFYQQQESSTTETVHKVINKGLKAYV